MSKRYSSRATVTAALTRLIQLARWRIR